MPSVPDKVHPYDDDPVHVVSPPVVDETTMNKNTEINNSNTFLAMPRGRKKNSTNENTRLKKKAIVNCWNVVACLIYDMKKHGERLPFSFIQGDIIKKEFGLEEDIIISKKPLRTGFDQEGS